MRVRPIKPLGNNTPSSQVEGIATHPSFFRYFISKIHSHTQGSFQILISGDQRLSITSISVSDKDYDTFFVDIDHTKKLMTTDTLASAKVAFALLPVREWNDAIITKYIAIGMYYPPSSLDTPSGIVPFSAKNIYESVWNVYPFLDEELYVTTKKILLKDDEKSLAEYLSTYVVSKETVDKAMKFIDASDSDSGTSY